MNERTDGELVAAAAGGDASAWDELVDRYAGVVWSVARQALGNDEATRASQATWRGLACSLGRLDAPERVGQWLVARASRETRRRAENDFPHRPRTACSYPHLQGVAKPQ